MTLKVLFFSTLRDITSEEEIGLDLPDNESPTVADLLEHLYIVYPMLREWHDQILIAIDHEYAERTQILAEGQEIAVMPPVQGG